MRAALPLVTAALCLVLSLSVSAQVPVTESPGIGNRLIAPGDAGKIFANACIKTMPSFSKGLATLASLPFVQSKSTGTYFHQRANLSLKIHGGECSMVFKAKDGDDGVVKKFSQGFAKALQKAPPRNITLTSSVAQDGWRYYRVGIKS